MDENLSYENVDMRPAGHDLHEGFIDFLNYIKQFNPKRVLEVGSYKGESAKLFKDILGDDIVLITIDPYLGGYDERDAASKILTNDSYHIENIFNTNMIKYNNYGKLKFKSEEIRDMFSDEYFDMIYIDGNHTYEAVKNDIQMYWSKIRTNGIMSGHDYFTFGDFSDIAEDCGRAIKEVVGEPEKVFKDSSWFVVKK